MDSAADTVRLSQQSDNETTLRIPAAQRDIFILFSDGQSRVSESVYTLSVHIF